MVGRNVLELVAVTVGAMGVVTLLVVIQASSHGRRRSEIVRAVGVLWLAIIGTLAAAVTLKTLVGGVFDVQLTGGPMVVWYALSAGQAAIVIGLMVMVVALYVPAIVAVRRLLASPGGAAVHPADLLEDDSE